jgi:hypothetical protein
LNQPAKELLLGGKVQAGTCLPRNNASASWYKLVPARQRQQHCPLVKPCVGAVLLFFLSTPKKNLLLFFFFLQVVSTQML